MGGCLSHSIHAPTLSINPSTHPIHSFVPSNLPLTVRCPPTSVQVPDAVTLRKAIVDQFERANMPSVPVEEKKRILSFVVVGGGWVWPGVGGGGEGHCWAGLAE